MGSNTGICFFIFGLLLLVPMPGVLAAQNLPRLNDVFRVTTHNSYWIKRSPFVEAFSTGAQENLLDQLLYENVRGIEIDIHKDKKNKGQWKVYHTERKKNSLCNPLSACLEKLRQFHYALPEHEVVTVVIELKQILGKNFDKNYTPEHLDRQIEAVLGPHLFRPGDFLKKCPAKMSLRQCAKIKGHPTIQDLRGKFIFTVLGNWRWCRIGHGASGWADYANYGSDIRKRSAFPHESDWGLFTKEKCGEEYIAPEKVKFARDNSLFLQVENMNDPRHMEDVAQFLADGGLVRAQDAYSKEEQAHRFGLGMHIVQTDYPWIQYLNHGKRQPLRPLRAENFPDLSVFFEPGSKILMKKQHHAPHPLFVHQSVVQDKFWFESFPATTRPSPNPAYPNESWTRGKGCLVVSSTIDLDDEQTEVLQVCRQTIESKGKHQEAPRITVEGRLQGRSFYQQFDNQGDLIRLEIDGLKVKVLVSDKMQADGVPEFKMLLKKEMESKPSYRGLLAQYGNVLFVGNRTNLGVLNATELKPSRTSEMTGYLMQDDSWR